MFPIAGYRHGRLVHLKRRQQRVDNLRSHVAVCSRVLQMRRGNRRIRDDRLFVNDRIVLTPRDHVPVVALCGIEVGLARGVLIDKHRVLKAKGDF